MRATPPTPPTPPAPPAQAEAELSRDPAIAWRLPMPHAQMLHICAALLAALGKPGAPVELALVSDREMAALNSQYLGCSGPTNVLSFSAGPENACPRASCDNASLNTSPNISLAETPKPLGTLFISPQTVQRECFFYNQKPEERFTALLAHGLAHLMGFEHGPDMDELVDNAIKTTKLQEKLYKDT